MTAKEVKEFCMGVARRRRGELTSAERKYRESREKVYQTVLSQNGGKNPLFNF